MYESVSGRPGDVRGFVHKRLLGAVGGFLEGGPLGGLRGFIRGGGGSREQANRAAAERAAQRAAQRAAEQAAQFPTIPVLPPFVPQRLPQLPIQRRDIIPSKPVCPPGFALDRGRCVPVGAAPLPIELPPPEAAAELGFGEARMGRFGAALEPEVVSGTTRHCPRGAVLGVDGLCYNRGSITNAQRAWPRGRRPLLTGGDMRCISVAARAATKLKGAQKRLEAIGLLKKPVSRRQRALPPAHYAHSAHEGA